MTVQKKTLKAHLIKYREPYLEDYIWFWINPTTGNKISGDFLTQEDAEEWFREMVAIYDESVSLIKRAKDGSFYDLVGYLEDENVKINKNCPFEHDIDGTLITVKVLGFDINDAKHRVETFYDIREWIQT